MTANSKLCTIGRIAEIAGVPRSTVNYYCRMGLIEPAGKTPGGYRLFHRQKTARKIRAARNIVESKVTLKELAADLAG